LREEDHFTASRNNVTPSSSVDITKAAGSFYVTGSGGCGRIVDPEVVVEAALIDPEVVEFEVVS
jgi:hypothetical protein